MKRPAGAWLILAVAGCAGPAPLDLGDLERADRRFVSPAEEKSRTREILAKDELTLAEVLEIADALNPQLEIERRNVDLATAAIWEAKLYPNPSARLAIEDYKSSGSLSDAKRLVGVSVPIVVGGRVGAATSVAEKEREVAAMNYVWKRREILSDVKRAFVDVLATRQNLALSRETRDLAKTFRDVTNERFKAQAIPEMELLKAEVNLAKAESDVKLAEKAAAVAIKALLSAMGNIDFPKERVAGELVARFTVPSFEALRGQVTTLHPLLEVAAKGREAAELQLSLARSERFPDVSLGLAGGKDGAGDTIFEGGIEVPLPLFNRNQAQAMRAEIRIGQAELQIQAVRNDLLLRLTEAYRTFVASQERVTLYKDEILPKAQKALDQTNEGYKLGKFGYLDFLDAQRTLAEARFSFVAALSDLNVAAVDLERLTGTHLESIR